MRRLAAFAAALLLTCAVAPPAGAAPNGAAPNAVFASPAPSLSQPRKIVLSLSEREPGRVDEVLNNLGNIQRYYGADNVQLALVAYGPGIHAVLKGDSTVAPRIAGLVAIGVEVLACGATLDTIHRGAADLLPGVKVVPNGLPEIVERQVAGWYYVRP